MAIRVKTGIFTGVVSAAAIAVTACSGGNQAVSLPSSAVLNALPGVYQKTRIASEGRFVTCADPSEIAVGDPVSRLTVNGLVVDTCGASDILILGTSTKSDGSGRYRIVTSAGTEDGTYKPGPAQITLVRDLVNGVALPATQSKQTTVVDAVYSTTGDLSVTPTPQPVSYVAVGARPPFNADGSLNADSVTPAKNKDGSVNVIVLSRSNDVAVLNTDLTVTVAPVPDSTAVIHPPSSPTVRAIQSDFVKKVYAPDAVPPTPAPAP